MRADERTAIMKIRLSIVSLSLIWVMGCSSVSEDEPSGPVARYGTTPTIDGMFADGEWDDAEIVRTDTGEEFRIKHDGKNLYFGLKAGGGDVWFDTDTGLHVLHWSGQLGSLEYTKSDTSTQTLDKPFAYELWGLREEPPAIVQETLSGYLFDNGWAANLASMGDLYQSELVVSFDRLGVNIESGRFVEIPGVRIEAGFIVSPNDPRVEEIMALSVEERRRRYPALYWPTEPAPDDSIGMGKWPETIRSDAADFGKIWIDLECGSTTGQE
jgi:hypothetical protein